MADMRTITRVSLLLVLSAATGSACATGRAQAPMEHRPALEVPAPPDRVVPQVPAPEPVLPAIEPVEDITKDMKPSSPTKPRPPAPKQEQPKPEVKPETPPPTDPPAAAPPTTPQLMLPESGDAGVVSRQIRDMVERTRRVLGQTQRATLSAVRQKAYDDAQGFVKQAEDALDKKNLKFAMELADKAERLANTASGK